MKSLFRGFPKLFLMAWSGMNQMYFIASKKTDNTALYLLLHRLTAIYEREECTLLWLQPRNCCQKYRNHVEMLLHFPKTMIYISVWAAPQGAQWFVSACSFSWVSVLWHQTLSEEQHNQWLVLDTRDSYFNAKYTQGNFKVFDYLEQDKPWG